MIYFTRKILCIAIYSEIGIKSISIHTIFAEIYYSRGKGNIIIFNIK